MRPVLVAAAWCACLLALALVNAAPTPSTPAVLEVSSVAQVKPAKPKEDYVVVVTRLGANDPVMAATSTKALLAEAQTPNGLNDTYPLLPDGTNTLVNDTYHVAPPPQLDPELRAAHGVDGDPVEFRTNTDFHPSEPTPPLPAPSSHSISHPPLPPIAAVEVKTPLVDWLGCNKLRYLDVRVLSAVPLDGHEQPVLPPRFGCSKEGEISREKVSPSVQWSNFSAVEVEEFSLQMVSMGDEACTGKGTDGYNRIHWHITGMKPDGNVFTLEEAASKDSRLLHGGTEHPNQWLEEYYAGPCPPPGVLECFRFKVLAHLRGGQSCYCGHQDVLFEKPANLNKPEAPWKYAPPNFSTIGPA